MDWDRIYPESYQDEKILARLPYTMPGETIVTAGAPPTQFPSGIFTHATDLPFEVHEVIPRASQSVAASPFIPIAEPAPNINKFWRIRIKILSINEEITQNAQLVDDLTERNTEVWPWRVPFTIRRAQGFVVTVENLLPVNFLRAEVTFRGYLIVTKLASENR